MHKPSRRISHPQNPGQAHRHAIAELTSKHSKLAEVEGFKALGFRCLMVFGFMEPGTMMAKIELHIR